MEAPNTLDQKPLRGPRERNWLFFKCRKQALKLAHKICPPDKVEDGEQEALLNLWHATQAWDPKKGSAFNTYAYTSVTRHLVRWLKREGRAPMPRPSAPDKPDPRPRGEASVLSGENQRLRRRAAAKLLLALPKGHRRVVRLRYVVGLTTHDVAMRMGVDRKKVFEILREARSYLRGRTRCLHDVDLGRGEDAGQERPAPRRAGEEADSPPAGDPCRAPRLLAGDDAPGAGAGTCPDSGGEADRRLPLGAQGEAELRECALAG